MKPEYGMMLLQASHVGLLLSSCLTHVLEVAFFCTYYVLACVWYMRHEPVQQFSAIGHVRGKCDWLTALVLSNVCLLGLYHDDRTGNRSHQINRGLTVPPTVTFTRQVHTCYGL
jgi:hypothetical protein